MWFRIIFVQPYVYMRKWHESGFWSEVLVIIPLTLNPHIKHTLTWTGTLHTSHSLIFRAMLCLLKHSDYLGKIVAAFSWNIVLEEKNASSLTSLFLFFIFYFYFLLGYLHDFGIMHRDLKVWEHVIGFQPGICNNCWICDCWMICCYWFLFQMENILITDRGKTAILVGILVGNITVQQCHWQMQMSVSYIK